MTKMKLTSFFNDMLYTVNGVNIKKSPNFFARSLAGKFIGGRATKVRPPSEAESRGDFQACKNAPGGGGVLPLCIAALYMCDRELQIICMAPPMSRLVCAARLRAPPPIFKTWIRLCCTHAIRGQLSRPAPRGGHGK